MSSHILNSTNTHTAPIGLFDSGVGGLSVYLHLKQKLPNEHFVYYADNLNVPYGNRNHEQIVELTMSAVNWLIRIGCKLIVIACNSASAHALEIARLKYPKIPIVGLVPALKPAVMQTKTKHVAVLATQATLNGNLLNQVIDNHAIPNRVEVIKSYNENLVPWVEDGMPKSCKAAQQLIEILEAFANKNVDYLVLGCTHYPFFRDVINNEVQKKQLNLKVIDSGDAIANRVHYLLKNQNDLLRSIAVTLKDRISSKSHHIMSNLEIDMQIANSHSVDMIKTRSNTLHFYVTDPQTDVDATYKMIKQLISKQVVNF